MKILPTLEELRKDYQRISAYKFILGLTVIFFSLAIASGIVSRAKEEKISRFHFEAETIPGNDDVVLHIGDYNPKDFTAYVELPNKSKEIVDFDYDSTLGEIKLKNFSRKIAGKYTLVIKERGLEIFQKDFTWGVLAINTNKTVYRVGELAKIQIGVLDEQGMMVCDANVLLEVFASDGRDVGKLSTENGDIIVNDDCFLHSFTENPDYETRFVFKELGDYQLKLTATTKNGTYSILDNIKVSDDILVDIERLTSTRIYPFDPYPVTFNIYFGESFEGRIEETVPEDFKVAKSPIVLEYDRVEPNYEEKTQKLIWDVSVSGGSYLNIGYVFDSPDISPNFYTLGELKLYRYDRLISNSLDVTPEVITTDVAGNFGTSQKSFVETSDVLESTQSLEFTEVLPVVEESSQSTVSIIETSESTSSSVSSKNFGQITTRETPYFMEFRKWQLAIDAATYTGKHTRTIEYVLGGNASGTAATDNTSRASAATVYAGTSWNTTKGSAGTKTVYIQGSGIKVLQAYVNVGFHINTAGGNNDLTDVDVTLDVANGPAGGSDIRVGMATAPIIQDRTTSDLTNAYRAYYDVTALFATQNDSQFNAGLATVGSLQHTGGARALTFMRLIITYEQDYSTTSHTETKTVRFPLNSSVSGDEGSTQAVCAASTTCGFTYTADIPDATADANIRDVFFEIHAQVNSATASTIQPQISGGTAGPAYAWIDAQAGDTNIMTLWRPTVGGSDFLRSTAQTLNIVNGTVPINILGGELVVTYEFSTGAATQTETVQYFMLQQTATSGVTKTTNSAVPTTISNTGFSVKNIWYKAFAAESEANTWTLFGTVGAGTERSQAYTVGGTNTIRAGAIAVVYLDLSQDVANYSSSTTNLDVETQWASATGDAPITVEAYITFTWSGSSGGTMTKSIKYSAINAGAQATASNNHNAPFTVSLPETVTKTHRSSYLRGDMSRADATNIVAGTVGLGLNATDAVTNIVTITEAAEEGTTTTAEGYFPTFFYNVSNTLFSDGSTIGWRDRGFTATAYVNQADEFYVSFELYVTYDADLGATDPQAFTTNKHMRTIEYVLGGDASGTATTDNTTRASNALVYAGSSWNTVAATAGTKTVYIQGSGIRVTHAYLDVGFHINTAGGANDLTDVRVGLMVPNSSAGTSYTKIDTAATTLIQDRAASDLTSSFRARYDATSLFDFQTDGEFNAGLGVRGYLRHTGGARALTTMKLVITYRQDYSTTSHTETKTVRFPLNSSVSGDEGSTQAVCAASTTCGFTYTADIPDATADANIRDVFFEIHAQVNSATASTIQPQISGGTAGPAYAWIDAQAGDTNIMTLWRPTVGGSDFLRSTAQTLNIVNGTVPINILGGELVVTYEFSTGAATQTETVQYFMLQQTATSGVTKTTNSAVPTTISNTGFSVKNIWYKAFAAESEANTWTLFGTVGAGTERSQAYTVGGTNTIRAGAIAVVYLDLSQDVANYSSSTTNLDVETQWASATGDAPITVEAYITFTWSGSSGGTVTKTVLYSGTPSGASAVANEYFNKPISITLSEPVTKTHRSTYVLADLQRHDATNITIGTNTVGVNTTTAGANLTTVTETGEEGTTTTAEGYLITRAHNVPNTMFSGGSDIPWKEKTFQITSSANQADELYASYLFVVTYDAALGGITLDQNHYRWRDDTAALNTSSGWHAAIDTAYTTLPQNTTVRLRVEVANTGGAGAYDYPFLLEYAARSGLTCGDETFTTVPVTATTEHFQMVGSAQYIDQASASSSLLTATGTFTAGRGVAYPANQSVAIDIPNGYYTELEYSIQATSNSTSSQVYCLRVTNVGSTTNFTYSVYPEVTISASSNNAPSPDPDELAQRRETPLTYMSVGDWTNETQVRIEAMVYDIDDPDDVSLCVEVDPVGVAFSNTEDSCGSPVTLTGGGDGALVTVTGLSDSTEYHWQVRAKDAGGLYSGWVSYGGNAESARDFGVDTTAPTGGTVFDGTNTGVDEDFSTTSLSQLSANWSGFNANVSGLNKYQYSIGTSAGGTTIRTWTDNGTTTSVTATGLTLQTDVPYYFNVRAVDNAGNTQSPVISSDGIYVSPSVTFSLSSNTVTFSNLNVGNSFTDTKTTTLTTSTNAYGGYVVRAYATALLTHSSLPSNTIQNFDGGTYASPDEWLTGDRGFGYTSSDTSVQGSNKFQNSPCPGGGTPPCYAPFSLTGPGDIVADHTANVTGTPISNEQFTVTYQVKTNSTQVSGSYSTVIVYTISAVY